MIPNQTLDWQEIHYQTSTIVDLHAHPALTLALFNDLLVGMLPTKPGFDPFSFRTSFPRLRQGGVDALLSVVYAPERQIVEEECRWLKFIRFLKPLTWRRLLGASYFEVANAMLDDVERVVAKAVDPATGRHLAQAARSVRELDAILAGGQDRPTAIIHCLEGGHCLGVGPEVSAEQVLANLEHFFKRGAAYLTLAHFFENELVNPCFPWPESMQRFGCFQGRSNNVSLGLKPLGEQVVERMIELGMLIDVSHCTPPARARIYEIVGNRVSLLATHVGAYAINPDPYNLQDWELQRIADGGGIIGVIFMNYWLMPHETKRGINFIARTLKHFVNVAGIDHVGIGSDFDGFTDPPDDLKDASELPKLTQRLIAEGCTADQIAKIWGGNALRVLREGWGRQQ